MNGNKLQEVAVLRTLQRQITQTRGHQISISLDDFSDRGQGICWHIDGSDLVAFVEGEARDDGVVRIPHVFKDKRSFVL